MYRDSFSETGWTRFVRTLSLSFRLGRPLGVEVRVFWLALVFTPLVVVRGASGLPFLEGAVYVAAVTLTLFVIVWTHEMSHVAAGRRYGIPTPLITLSPLGGVAHMSANAPTPRAEIVVAVAGPAVHVLWLALFYPLSLLVPFGAGAPSTWHYDPLHEWIAFTVYANLLLAGFNLLPFFPLDGGRVFRALLAGRMHPNRATALAARVGTIGGIAFLGLGVALWILGDDLWGLILALIGISNIVACKRERIAAEHSPGPYMQAEPRAPWQSDPEAWKAGAAAAERKARKDGRRALRKREQQAAADAALEADLDRVLARVSEVGLQGLTRKERAILERASRRRQG